MSNVNSSKQRERGVMAILTSGNDSFAGSSGADLVFSADGNDLVVAGLGNDIVFGGEGADRLQGGGGNDLVAGGAGNDILSGGNGKDFMWGGAGNDVIAAGGGDATMSGGSGADAFQFGAGGFGDDTIVDFQFGVDTLQFFAGSLSATQNVSISSFAQLQQAVADFGLTVSAIDGTDGILIEGFRGGNTLTLMGAADEQFGTVAPNSNIAGSSGADTLFGNQGNNHIIAGAGNDTIYAGDGVDLVQGGTGNDVISGDAGNDSLSGQAGNDTIFGGAGNDVVVGGTGDDILTGDDGNDAFQFSAGYGHDTVTDFENGDTVTFFLGTVDNSHNVSATSVDDLHQIAVDSSLPVAINGDSVTLTTNGGDSVTFIGIADEWNAIV
jgi:Ca2+-binding RTX toxin-like protein